MEIFSTLVCVRILHQMISLEALERKQRKKVLYLIYGELFTLAGTSLLKGGGGCKFSNQTVVHQERLFRQTPNISQEHISIISF